MKIKNEQLLIHVCCLLGAILLYVFIALQTTNKVEYPYANVKIEVRGRETLEKNDLQLMNDNQDNLTTTVTLLGYNEELAKIKSSDISAYINVSGFSEGATNIADVVVLAPTGYSSVEVKSMTVKQIYCQVDKIIPMSIDVSVEFDGDVESGYYQAAPDTSVSSVNIRGPRSVVNSAKYAVVNVTGVAGATGSISGNYPVRIIDDTGKERSSELRSITPETVGVSVPVYPTKTVSLVPNIEGMIMEGYKVTGVSVEPRQVTIAAERSTLDSISDIQLEPVDVTDAYNNIIKPKVSIINNGFIIMGNVEPRVTVTIEKIIQNEYSYALNEIEFTNIPEGMKLDMTDEDVSVNLTLEGATSSVNKLMKDNIKIKAALIEGVPGLNTAELEYTVEGDFKEDDVTITMTPASLNVNIIEDVQEGGDDENVEDGTVDSEDETPDGDITH